jgi:hypothetical protein
MRKLFFLGALCLASVPAWAQPSGTSAPVAPDCYDQGTFTAVGTSQPRDWTRSGCTAWHLFYQATSGISVISIEMDGAPEGVTFGTQGSFTAMTGLAAGTTNPATILPSSSISASPLATPGWTQANLTVCTGCSATATVTWELFGYRPGVQTTPQNGFGTVTTMVPGAYNGWTPSMQSALSTTVTTLKGAPGELGMWQCYNPAAAVSYVQVFDTAGAVTLGTTVPKFVIGVPTVTANTLEAAMGIHFAAGIKVAATTTPTGSTAPATALVCSFGFN